MNAITMLKLSASQFLKNSVYLKHLSCSGGMFGFSSLGSPESGSGESDLEFSYPLISSELFVRFFAFHSLSSDSEIKVNVWQLTVVLTEMDIKTEKGESRLKRPRGRPPKVSREHSSSIYDNPKKSKHGEACLENQHTVHHVELFIM